MKNLIHRRLFAFVAPLLIGVTACDALSSASQSLSEDSTLQIWWSEGYYPEETEPIREAVTAWSEENAIEVELVFYSEKDPDTAKRECDRSRESPGYPLRL